MQNNMTKLALLFGVVATMGFGAMNTASADTSERTGGLGHVTLVLAGPDGDIKKYVQTDNVITHIGLDCLVESVFTAQNLCSSVADFDIIAIGIGNSATASSTALSIGLGNTCQSAQSSGPTVDSGTTTQTVTIEVVFGGSSSGTSDITSAQCEVAVTEAGLFNVGGPSTTPLNMFAYQTFTAITIAAADTLTVTWSLDFT